MIRGGWGCPNFQVGERISEVGEGQGRWRMDKWDGERTSEVGERKSEVGEGQMRWRMDRWGGEKTSEVGGRTSVKRGGERAR